MKRFLALLIVFSLFALPLHAGVTGSVSLANSRLSLVDGTAFVDFSAAGTLTPYIGGKLTLTDSAGKKAVGYIKAAGTGETYLDIIGGADPTLGDGDFNSNADWTVGTGWSIDTGAKTASHATSSGYLTSKTGAVVVGALYYGAYTITSIPSGGANHQLTVGSAGWPYAATTGEKSAYRVATSTHAPSIYAAATQTMTINSMTVRKVLTPSATGVTIVSTPGGTTYNWASIEAGFNYNDAAGYTYTIIPRFVGGGLGMGIMYGF